MRKNAPRADNQQERLEKIPSSTASYFAGFVDGEGSFNAALIPRKEYRFGWKIYLTFNVAQKDPSVLKLMKKYFPLVVCRIEFITASCDAMFAV